ncbi:hypothetical protein EVAR_32318_1 [Eumeta japonica]|uniref:Uncharacterized protein n=1 Tax=Eumeta variegata TaxID=151549 RepID=A0A4C1ZBH1_EUMVA|nr:hypothetical protein EVAR_32318_1 [Eumeta japonica]
MSVNQIIGTSIRSGRVLSAVRRSQTLPGVISQALLFSLLQIAYTTLQLLSYLQCTGPRWCSVCEERSGVGNDTVTRFWARFVGRNRSFQITFASRTRVEPSGSE